MLAPSNPFGQGGPVEGLPHSEELQPQLLARRDAEDGESEEEYRVMVDLRSAGKAQLEPESGRFRRVNRKLCEMTGYSAEELRGMTWQDLLDRQEGEQAGGWQQVLHSTLSEYGPEVRYRRKDGSIRWGFFTAARPAEQRVPEPLVIAVLQDMTEANRLEQALRESCERVEQRTRERTQILRVANKKLQEHNRLQSAFLSIGAHEIRTPLTAIQGYVDNMLNGVTGPLTEKQEAYLRRMLASTQRLVRLIRDLLNLSRIEVGQPPVGVAPVSLPGLVDEMVATFEPVANKKSVTLQARLAEHLPQVNGDRDKLYQVLSNLLENAIKFTEPGGTVDVEASVQDGGWIQLCVSDTGRGIAPDELAHVFESFYRGSGKSRHDGTGLGLTITKKLVELHSGRIWLDSTVGKGSRFYVALPLYVPLRPESLPPPLCPL